jgi:plastocyanin
VRTLSAIIEGVLIRAAIVPFVLVLAVACAKTEEPPAASPQAAAPTVPGGRTTLTGQAPAGSVVSLEPAVAREHALPEGPAVLDQYGKAFVPDLLVVRVGQPVEFRNSEDVDHNVAVARSPTGTKIFDTSTSAYEKYVHTFDRAGRYDVSCDVHPGMRATIIAATTPYVTVVDGSGRFRFADLEPGPYTLAVSGTRSLERKLEVTGGEMDLGVLIRDR